MTADMPDAAQVAPVEVYRIIKSRVNEAGDLPRDALTLVCKEISAALGTRAVRAARVKTLEWRQDGGDGFRCFSAETAVGRFAYGTDRHGKPWHQEPGEERDHPTEEAARLAAERAHFVRVRDGARELGILFDIEPAEAQAPHPDDLAADSFAVAMKDKLAKKRARGRGGWEDKDGCTNSYLSELLRDHVEKGDPVDVGNLAMMIHQRGERIEFIPDPAGAQEDVGGRDRISEVIREEGLNGAACGWRPCTGCHETNEGASTGFYPRSKVFSCEVGSGCRECGGLGVVWEHYSARDLDEMAKDLDAEATPAPAADVAGLVKELRDEANVLSEAGTPDSYIAHFVKSADAIEALQAEVERRDLIASDLQALCDRQAIELGALRAEVERKDEALRSAIEALEAFGECDAYLAPIRSSLGKAESPADTKAGG